MRGCGRCVARPSVAQVRDDCIKQPDGARGQIAVIHDLHDLERGGIRGARARQAAADVIGRLAAPGCKARCDQFGWRINLDHNQPRHAQGQYGRHASRAVGNDVAAGHQITTECCGQAIAQRMRLPAQ